MGNLGLLPYGMSLTYSWMTLVPTTYLNDADQQDFTCMWHLPSLPPSTSFEAILTLPRLRFTSQTPQKAANALVVCPTEILAFNKAIADFQAIGAEVIVSSTDSEFESYLPRDQDAR